MRATQRDGALDETVHRRRGVETIVAAGSVAAREHRTTLLCEFLFGSVVDGRDAGQCHRRQQCLLQSSPIAADEEAIDIVVVHERGHQLRVRVQRHHAADAVAKFGSGMAAREHVDQRAVEREVDHGRQSARRTHVTVELSRMRIVVRLVGAETLAEHMETAASRMPRHAQDAGCLGIGGMEEIREEIGRHVECGIDPEPVDANLADPVSIRRPQCAPHHRVFSVEIVQPSQLEIGFLMAFGEIGDVRRPVVDGRRALRRIAGVIAIERRLRWCATPARIRVEHEMRGRIRCTPTAFVGEEIRGVVDHDVLYQRHARCMKRVRQRLVVVERAVVRIDLGEVLRPVTVIAAEVAAHVPPLVGDRWRDPHGGGAECADVVDASRHPAQVAAAVFRAVGLIVFTGTLVVVGRVAIVEAIEHQEIDHLVAPVGRDNVTRICDGRIAL